jgi:hypothetical protein
MFKTKKQQSIGIILSGTGAFILLVSLMNAFSPDQFVPIGALTIFLLIYVVCFALSFVVYSLFAGLFSMLITKRLVTSDSYRVYFYLAIISMAPVVMLAIQSIRDITIAEISLIMLFCILICFYISRR